MADSVASQLNNDMLNELLIAKLLEEDMRLLENARAAEELQLKEALNTSALAAGRFPKRFAAKANGTPRNNEDVVLQVLAAEVTANKDALMAQALQHSEDSNTLVKLKLPSAQQDDSPTLYSIAFA